MRITRLRLFTNMALRAAQGLSEYFLAEAKI